MFWFDKDFGENYADLGSCVTKEQFKKNDQIADTIITQKHLDREYKDVLDFLYMPDSEGSISYKTCKKIYDLIKDVDFGSKEFRYAAYSNNDYKDFKEFLKECWSKKRKMRWF